MKRLFRLLLAIGLVMSLTACSSSARGDTSTTDIEEKVTNKAERKADSYNSVELANLLFQIPDFYGENTAENNTSLNYYAETGEQLAYMNFEYTDQANFEKKYSSDYKKVVDDFFSGLFGSEYIKDGRKLKSKQFTTSEGLEAVETPFEVIFDNNGSDIHLEGLMTIVNNAEYGKIVLVSVIQSKNSKYAYFETYRKMINEAKPTKASSSNSENTSQDKPSDNASQAPAETSPSTDSSSIRPEFKQTMDNYEAWFDHYCEVMKAYKENPSDMNLMIEMTNLLSEEAAMLDEMEKMDQSEMNAAELAYYIEVTARIEKKLIEVAY